VRVRVRVRVQDVCVSCARCARVVRETRVRVHEPCDVCASE
jgi:hypothetical protein